MPRVASDQFDDEPDDDADERDDPLESDQDDSDADDDVETLPCPYCGKPVYEHADVCPYCRNFISFDEVSRRQTWLIWAGVILAVLAALVWVLRS